MSLYRKGLRQFVGSREDIEVIGEAENGKALFDLLNFHTPDIITLNIQMPIMDGLTALPLLKEKFSNIKILMISMHNIAKVNRQCIELGANGYLTKSASSEEIYHSIRKLSKYRFLINKTVIEAFVETENESDITR